MSEDKATKASKENKLEEEKEAEIKADIAEVTQDSKVSEEGNKEGKKETKKESVSIEKRKKTSFVRSRRTSREREVEKEFEEKVISIDRVTRVVKGGRRMRFRALVVIGDKKGRVGYATGKGNEVAMAVSKAVDKAKKNLVKVEILNGTIAHDVVGKSRGAKVLLKFARKGRGIIAGGSVRVVLELAGFNDVVAKSFGSSNKINNVIATIDALQSLLKHKKLITKERAKKEIKKK